MDNLFQNIPLIIFATIFTIAFFVFLIGGFIYLIFKDPEKKELGKRVLIRSIYWFSAFVLIAIVYSGLTWFLNQDNQILVQSSGEFPVSPVSSDFPPAPKSIKIASIDFSGPFSLVDNYQLNSEAIYLVLCKSKEKYDTMYIGETGYRGFNLAEHEELNCWLENCGGNTNLYLAIFWINNIVEENREFTKLEAIQVLKESLIAPCPPEK